MLSFRRIPIYRDEEKSCFSQRRSVLLIIVIFIENYSLDSHLSGNDSIYSLPLGNRITILMHLE
jgi:hypothetical protein